MRKLLLGLTLAATTAFGAEGFFPFGIGVKGGVPLNDAFVVQQSNPITYVADTHRYTFGPYVELRLPAGFALEVDALFKTYEYRQVVPATFDRNSHAWEFPVLVKKKFLPGPLNPYLEAGGAFSHLSTANVRELHDRDVWGLVIGGGVELKIGGLRITPEIRYTGWTSRHFESPGTLLQSNRNQAAVMLGIGF